MQTILGHGSYSIREQGNNFVLNMLFGVVVNAASGIATTINGLISHFTYNVLTAFRPQIIKSYAHDDIKHCNNLIISASKYSALLILLIIIPFEFEAPYIIKLWLNQLPLHAVSFNRIMMISLFTCMTNPVYVGLTATGNIKHFSIVQACLYLTCPIIIYFACNIFNIPEIAYFVIITLQFAVGLLTLIFYKKYVRQFSILNYVWKLIYSVISPTILSISLCYVIYKSLQPGLYRLIIIVIVNFIVLITTTYILIGKVERSKLNKIISSKFK